MSVQILIFLAVRQSENLLSLLKHEIRNQLFVIFRRFSILKFGDCVFNAELFWVSALVNIFVICSISASKLARWRTPKIQFFFHFFGMKVY